MPFSSARHDHTGPQDRLARKIPEKIGKYAVVNEVGRGSTGIVYLSHDAYYGRDVAIKVYNMDAGGDEERARIARKMFLSEAHLVGMLQHPHILPIYDAGEENGHCYIVTEHVHGARTLAAYCRAGQPAAHRRRRRDHLQVREGAALRALARRDPSRHQAVEHHAHAATATCASSISASRWCRTRTSRASKASRAARRYMSPEQVQSFELTNRSDLYSLGAVMYELLTGSRPFRAGNLQKLLHQIVYATPPPIHTLRKEIPEELENVVATALQKEPDKRYKSGAGFRGRAHALHQKLREQNSRIDRQEQFGVLRRLKFFHEFSHAEIWEVLRASSWQDYAPRRGDRQGRRDGRPLLHHRVRQLRGGAPRHRLSARSIPATASARRATCRAPSARPRFARRATSPC